VSEPGHQADELFRPLRPARGLRLAAAVVFGPLLWFIAFVFVSIAVDRTNAIEFGLLVTIGSFVVAFPLLVLLRWRRERERRSYDPR
jgi:hypothetical protein